MQLQTHPPYVETESKGNLPTEYCIQWTGARGNSIIHKASVYITYQGLKAHQLDLCAELEIGFMPLPKSWALNIFLKKDR